MTPTKALLFFGLIIATGAVLALTEGVLVDWGASKLSPKSGQA